MKKLRFEPSCDVLQVVERLEADLGVKVQQVGLPGLRYGFQIWDTYMSLPDKDGKVGPNDSQITHSLLFVFLMVVVVGLTVASSYGESIDQNDTEPCTWQHAWTFPIRNIFLYLLISFCCPNPIIYLAPAV